MVFDFRPAQENYIQSEQRHRVSPSDLPQEAKKLRKIAITSMPVLGPEERHDLNATIYTHSLMQNTAWPETSCASCNPNHK
jgi:hypothetical protein